MGRSGHRDQAPTSSQWHQRVATATLAWKVKGTWGNTAPSLILRPLRSLDSSVHKAPPMPISQNSSEATRGAKATEGPPDKLQAPDLFAFHGRNKHRMAPKDARVSAPAAGAPSQLPGARPSHTCRAGSGLPPGWETRAPPPPLGVRSGAPAPGAADHPQTHRPVPLCHPDTWHAGGSGGDA